MTKGVKILVVIMITVAIALTSFFVMKKAYDESQKEIEEENNEYYSINEFLKNNNSIPLVMAVKNNEVIDSFVGEKDSKDVEKFLKKNLNIE